MTTQQPQQHPLSIYLRITPLLKMMLLAVRASRKPPATKNWKKKLERRRPAVDMSRWIHVKWKKLV